jgi:hypothetical protein
LTRRASLIMLTVMTRIELSGAGADDASLADAYVDHAAMMSGIALNGARRERIVAAFMGYQQAATLLMDFPLPSQTVPASVYTLP